MPNHSDNLYCAILCNQNLDALGNPCGERIPPIIKISKCDTCADTPHTFGDDELR
ncbi:hypothetical protein H6G35_25645 [Aulosira sp. FACHB-113]|uniref:hypothetical protein n=1 Tax=Tolypothrix tenuis TaxID=457083 RepID=UPI0016826D60|nr:hypothetical protein [Aulosira sp. FACHB-113]